MVRIFGFKPFLTLTKVILKDFSSISQQLFSLFIILSMGLLSSCEHDQFHSGKSGDFRFSTDTVMFDTIFTNIGTSTYKLSVKNPNDFKLIFDSIYVTNNQTSQFIININGEVNLPAKSISIDAHDSIYIFIQAFLPQTSDNNPFIQEDSLVFVSGLHQKNVKLIAFGQNAVHFKDQSIQSQEWISSKPYLIYGTVTLESGSVLNIHEGVKVYFHRNAKLNIRGTLNILGTYQSPVFFDGDRIEKDYDTIPGQWGGIILTGAEKEHRIAWANIRNGTTGIQLGDYTNDKKVSAVVSNTIIANMAFSAIVAYQASILAENCVLANTGNNVCSLYGGDYVFRHCTLANYGARYVAQTTNSKTLVLQNFVDTGNGEAGYVYKDLNNAYFGNTIIYGYSSNETSLRSQSGHSYNYTFENCLIRIPETSVNNNFKYSIVNKSPRFISAENENFRLDTLSAAKDAANAEIGILVPFDLDNNTRIGDKAPDIGAYERKEKQ